jgi:transposase InsO family protein
VPHRSSIYRILVRFGLVTVKPRKKRRSEYKRWQRDAPMELWQLDIVGSCFLISGKELKVVTGVDDHSRYCVIAAVVPRATSRAVCTAFVQALSRFGCPEQVLTDIQSGCAALSLPCRPAGKDRCRPAPARHRCLTEWSAWRLLAC